MYIICVCVRMFVCTLVWKTITKSCILTEYDTYLEIGLTS